MCVALHPGYTPHAQGFWDGRQIHHNPDQLTEEDTVKCTTLVFLDENVTHCCSFSFLIHTRISKQNIVASGTDWIYCY